MADKPFVHPYIPNSVPETKQAMLDELGLSSVEEIYAEIPDRLRFKGTLDIPPAILSERQLRKHVQGLLDTNTSSVDFMNFCGAGCWQHHVPSVVDEIINRAEFLSAYCGGDYSDLGKYLTRYEFNSMLGELLDYDAVANPIYDWGDVAGRSFRMARRITGRDTVLVPAHMSPMRLMEARTLCQPESMANSTKIRFYEWDRETGMVDLEDLKAKLDDSYAAVYWESPGYLGTIEANGAEIVKLAHSVRRARHQRRRPDHARRARAARRHRRRHRLRRHPAAGHAHARRRRLLRVHRLHGRRPGLRPGVPARALHRAWRRPPPASTPWARRMADRTSYGVRDQGKDWVGTASGLWTIAAAVYMALMGPQGFREVGETCIARSHYAAKKLGELPGVEIKLSPSFFKEFVVNFDGTGKSVAEVNKALLGHQIFGGKDVSAEFPELGQSALYCVTEYYDQADIDALVSAVKEVTA